MYEKYEKLFNYCTLTYGDAVSYTHLDVYKRQQLSTWTMNRRQNMSETVISIKDLSKSFGDHEVLRKIDIDVHSGEVI